MEKFKQKLKSTVKDKTAAFAIVIAIIITWLIVFGIVQLISYNNYVKANANVNMAQTNSSKEIDEIEESKKMEEEAKKESKIEDEEKLKKENEEKYEELKKKKKVNSAADKYYIKVNYGAQVVTVYKKDEKGKYTVPVRAMVCSTGTHTPTSGVYRTLGKGNWWPLMGDVYGQYSTWICDDILFHSVPYLTKGDKSSLEYWAYDQLGKRVSMGCVRLTTADALWIYNNCAVGTQVEFYASSNPGPLGKPSTMKISDAPDNIRGWDPTDPDPKNPWSKYLEEQENKKEEDKKENTIEAENTVQNEITNTVIEEPANEPENNTIGENVIENTVANENNINNTVDEGTSENVINNTIEDGMANSITEEKTPENIVDDSSNAENTINNKIDNELE